VSGDALRVAFVCTGNRFRSPLAAALFEQQVGGRMPLAVDSYGTLPVDAAPALPEAEDLAPRYGVDLSTHRARQLRRGDLEGAELVLGFEKFHLAAAIVDGGADRSRAFTLPELVQLLERLAPAHAPSRLEHARSLLAAASAARGEIVRPSELADPFGEPQARQRAIADQLAALTERLAWLLLGA
jgi:protein-tyrosine phosphatase